RNRAGRPAHVRAHARGQDRRRPAAGRDPPQDAPAVHQLPLLGTPRPVGPRGLDQRRELLHDEPQGALRGIEEEGRPPAQGCHLHGERARRRSHHDARGARLALAQRAAARRIHRPFPARGRPVEPDHQEARDRLRAPAAQPGLPPRDRPVRRGQGVAGRPRAQRSRMGLEQARVAAPRGGSSLRPELDAAGDGARPLRQLDRAARARRQQPAGRFRVRPPGLDMIASESLPAQFNVASWFVDRNVTEGRGATPAFQYEGRTLTYGQVQELVNRTGNALLEIGVEPENRVLMLCLDAPEFIGTFWGAIKIGAVPIPTNTLMRTADYLYFLNDSRAKVAVVSAPLLAEAGPALAEAKHLKHVLIAGGAAGPYTSFEDRIGKASTSLEAAATSPPPPADRQIYA